MNQQNVNPNIPHNQLAEEAFLAYLLTEPEEIFGNDAISLDAEDFYDTRHQIIFEVAFTLHENYETINLIAIISNLQRLGKLHEAGGLEYIRELVNPTKVSNFGTNPVGLSLIIEDERRKRDLLNLSLDVTSSVQPGSGLDGSQALESAEERLNYIIQTQGKSDTTRFAVKDEADDIMQQIRDLADAPPGSTPTGVPSGFDRLDDITTGFKGGQFIIIAARPGIGKALCVETPILTDKGFVKMGLLTDEMNIYGSDGRTYPIIKAHEPFKSEKTYKVNFSDGTFIVADEKHDWLTIPKDVLDSRDGKSSAVRSLIEDLQHDLNTTSPDDEYSVFDILNRTSQVDVGYFRDISNIVLNLKHTGFSYAVLDKETVEQESEMITDNMLITLRVFHNALKKCIDFNSVNETGMIGINPVELASEVLGGPKSMDTVKQFLSLLNGSQALSVSEENGEFRLYTPVYNKIELLEKVKQQIQETSLLNLTSVSTTQEIKDTLFTKDGKYNHHIPYANVLRGEEEQVKHNASMKILNSFGENQASVSDYNQAFGLHGLAVRAGRKADITHEFSPRDGHSWKVTHQARSEVNRELFKKIISVEEIESKTVRCISVDSPDESFLAGESLTVTHNSTLAVDFARSASFLAGKTVMFFSLEMSRKELITRILSAEARVESNKLKKGNLTKEDWLDLGEARDKLNTGNFIIDEATEVTVSYLRAAATKQAMKPEGLDMIVIDYLQLMSMNDRIPRQQAVSDTSRSLKVLSKELDVPIIILSQLNRKSEERSDGKPMLSDLRESGSLEQDADMVFLLNRPEANNSDERPGETDLIIAKHRGGETGIIPLTSMLQYSKFVPGSGMIQAEAEELEALGIDSEGGEDDQPW